MRKLIVKKSGLILRISGLKEVRSPVEIDISKIDYRKVISSLKRDGITQFKIITDEKKGKNIESKDNKLTSLTKETEEILRDFNDNSSLKNIENKLNKIEFLIERIISDKKNLSIEENEIVKKIGPKNTENNLDPDFIPSIDITGLSSRKPKIEVLIREEQIEEIAKKLKNTRS